VFTYVCHDFHSLKCSLLRSTVFEQTFLNGQVRLRGCQDHVMPRRASPGCTRPQPLTTITTITTITFTALYATRNTTAHLIRNASAFATRPQHTVYHPAPSFCVACCLSDSGRHPCVIHKASCTPWTRRLGFGSGVGFWLLEGRYSGLRWLRGAARAACSTRSAILA
jgi:hypothetical protein